MLKSAQQALGLYRTPNQLGVAQDGAYVRLDECVIRSKDVVEPRLGHSLVANYINANKYDTRRFNALFQSSVGYLGQYGSGTTSGLMCLDEYLGTAILSDIDPPSVWSRTKFADCQKRCYLTSDGGLKRVTSSLVGTAAGGLRAKINTQLSHPIYSTTGNIAANTAVMYRAHLVSFAPDGSEIVGPPSNRWQMRIGADQTIGIGGVVRVSNVTTYTTPARHNLRVGDAPYITFQAADTGANEFTTGAKTILSVPTATTFTVTDVAADYTSTATATLAIGPAYGKTRVLLPSTAAITDLVRLFRSETASGATATPFEDVYQVFESYITAANLSAGYIEISDNTPEVMLGDPSYFSPSVEGESGANETPPLPRDVCAVGDQLLLGHLTFPHLLEFRLLATGGSSGPDGTGGGLTIERSGYTTIEPRWQQVIDADGICVYNSPAGSAAASIARDIEATALGIVDCINTYTGNDWLDAFYISSAADAPGKILLRARDFVATAFTIEDATYPTAFAPNLPATGTQHTSRQEVDPSGLVLSKPGQPDAYPATNRLRCGAQSEQLLRILPVRDKVIALKEESAWLISGARVDLLDDTCGFPLPDTAAVLDNQVFCLSTIGVVAVSEAGVAKYGSPIEGDTRNVSEQAGRVGKLIAANYVPHCLASWGASDETEHRYLLAIPSSLAAGDSSSHEQLTDIVWCFNAGSRVWSGPLRGNWRHAHRWVSSSSSSRLAFALHNLPAIAKEQGIDAPEALRHSDYLGLTGTAIQIGANSFTLMLGGSYVGGTYFTFGDESGSMVDVGDALYVSSTGFCAVITAKAAATDLGNGFLQAVLTVDDGSGLADGTSVIVLKAFEAVAEWVPLHGGAFPADKQLSGVVLTLSEERFTTATVKVSSEVSGAELDAKTLSRPGLGSDMVRQSDGSDDDKGFGYEPFGHLAPLRRERCQVPRDVQSAGFHSVTFRVKEAGAFFRLHGLTLDFESSGIKGVR